MAEEQQKAGLDPAVDGTDAGDTAGTAGTTEGKGRDAAMAEADIVKLNQEWRTEIEKQRAQIADLQARIQQPPAAATVEDPREKRLQAVRQYADRDDPVAQLLLEEREERETLVREIGHAQQLRDISDKALRARVLDHFNKNRHRFGDPNAALSDITAQEQGQEISRLRSEVERLTKTTGSEVVRTDTREVGASEHKTRKMTYAQFDAEQARLAAAGQHKAKMAMQLEVDQGKIDLE